MLYPGIPSIPGQMAFSFVTNEKIESGGTIRVGYPRDIEVLCSGLYLNQVALTGEVTCINFLAEAKRKGSVGGSAHVKPCVLRRYTM